MVFIVIMLFYAVQRINVMQLGYEIEELKKEKTHLEQIHNSLLIERAALASTERIEKIAVTVLDMKRPDDSQLVIVSKERDEDKLAAADTVTEKEDNPSSLTVVKYFDWRP